MRYLLLFTVIHMQMIKLLEVTWTRIQKMLRLSRRIRYRVLQAGAQTRARQAQQAGAGRGRGKRAAARALQAGASKRAAARLLQAGARVAGQGGLMKAQLDLEEAPLGAQGTG
jgi:hypothetical protein